MADRQSAQGQHGTPAPLILLPGLGADWRMFQAQRAAFPQLLVPSWIPHRPNESLAEYAARLAADVDPGGPCFLGGTSFGGLVALEMARHLRTRAVFLIGSVRSPRGMHAGLRALRQIAWLVKELPFAFLGPLAGLSLRHAGRFSSIRTRGCCVI